MFKLFVTILLFSFTSFSAAISGTDIIYFHPKPDANGISVKSQLIFKVSPENTFKISTSDFNLKVIGSKSGSIAGKKIISGNTFIFRPYRPFAESEVVTVIINNFKYTFSTREFTDYNYDILYSTFDKSYDFQNETESVQITNYETRTINGVSVPADFPVFNVSISSDEQAPGKIFLNNWGGEPYIMVLNQDGSPYAYKRVENRARDFKIQPNGMLTRRILGDLYAFVGMDSSFAITDTFACANGFGTDEHEIYMLEDGHYFLIALDYRNVDMSQVVSGGKPNATIIENHVQEFDENKNLVFEWLSNEHFEITDAVHENLTSWNIDYIHMNSIGTDYDGHILTSSRHLDECTKIDRNTGELIWRLGGENNQFLFENDDYKIAYQHYIRAVPGKPGHYTIFDNGNHRFPEFSRAVEFKLDKVNMVATKVWEFDNNKDWYTWWMGNCDRLPNGNTYINFADASLPKAVEVTPDGQVVLQGTFENSYHCYRSFKKEYNFIFAEPYLLVEGRSNHIELIFNKFGDDDVSYYKIYSSTNNSDFTLLDSATVTNIKLYELDNHTNYYFRVTAVNSSGEESKASNTVNIFINFIGPNINFISNGEFSNGTQYWNFNTFDVGDADGGVNQNKEYEVNITNGGTDVWHVQLTQNDLPFVNGKEYRFEFDAWATQNRSMLAVIEKNGDPWTNYSQSNEILLKRFKQHYTFDFTMEAATDYQARVTFNMGENEHDVFIDNVSVMELGSTDIREETLSPLTFGLGNNYPNPFNPETTISYTVPDTDFVTIDVYDVTGQHVKHLLSERKSAGIHSVKFKATGLSAGVYFYQIKYRNNSITKKMMLLK